MATRDLARIALFAAVTAALGLLPPIAVPLIPVPVTAQTLGVMLAGSVLGARRGGLSQLAFLALVAVGLPLLSGGRGGLAVLAGPTGGFALAFPVGAWAVGRLTELLGDRYTFARGLLATVGGGIVVVYAIGIPYLAVVTGLGPLQAALGTLIFVPGDLVKAAIAVSTTLLVRRAYPELR